MTRYFKRIIQSFLVLLLPVCLYAQKDVTQFLGIPVDGFKPEMIAKLKSKGFTVNPHNKEVLTGEFNGTDVNVHIVTNNNKVYRIMVSDANPLGEGDIKIRFNKLCQQFHNNKNYLLLSDSAKSKYTIPEEEDISYELLVNNKRYQAVFYQKSANYDSLVAERNTLFKKEPLDDKDKERLSEVLRKTLDVDLSKEVWFMISSYGGKYFISIYYDNIYNKANGEDL